VASDCVKDISRLEASRQSVRKRIASRQQDGAGIAVIDGSCCFIRNIGGLYFEQRASLVGQCRGGYKRQEVRCGSTEQERDIRLQNWSNMESHQVNLRQSRAAIMPRSLIDFGGCQNSMLSDWRKSEPCLTRRQWFVTDLTHVTDRCGHYVIIHVAVNTDATCVCLASADSQSKTEYRKPGIATASLINSINLSF